MTIERFEDIVAWQKSQILVIELYKLIKTCPDYSFRDQIQRAAISIMNNIAEGFERRTNKEFINFLYIAKGSAGEVRSMLKIASQLGFIQPTICEKYAKNCEEISKIISGLIKTL